MTDSNLPPDAVASVLAACGSLTFPTPKHREAVRSRALQLSQKPGVQAVGLTCSLAREMGCPTSDLDFVVYTDADSQTALQEAIESEGSDWDGFWCDVTVSDGNFTPDKIRWTYAGDYELTLGNLVAYARPLYDPQGLFQRLARQYLPYYNEATAQARQRRFLEVTLNHVTRIRVKTGRGLHFGAVDRLYGGVRSLIAGLFVASRTYPVSYGKWMEHEIGDLLGQPELLPSLRRLFDLGELEPSRLLRSAEELESLAYTWIPATGERR